MLFPSTLVISSEISDIQPFLSEMGHETVTNNPDIFTLNNYDIESVRSIDTFLHLTPYSHQSKIVIIPQADNLSPESQNTLLKNLEEPGNNNYFILLTTRPQSLIPTILSRCQTIRFTTKTKKDLPSPLNFPKDMLESLKLSEELSADKDFVKTMIDDQIRATPPQEFQKVNKLIKANRMLKANLDPKTVLDFLFLS